MPTRWQVCLATVVMALIVAAPLVYSSHQQTHRRNFRVVEDGILYRSGQLTPEGLDRILREKNIRTVISLRGSRQPGNPPPDAWEEAFCQERGVQFVRLEPRVWGENEKGEIPAQQNVTRFVELLADSQNHPVLVHCFAGIHRTGTLCAIYRMYFQGWPADRAIDEMELYGFAPEDLHEHIAGYLRNYPHRLIPKK